MSKRAYEKIAAGLEDAIRISLRALYNSTAREPVPERFTELLGKMK